ncbi:YbaY family lipoprotein [Pseudomonas alabamensis]|jgi:uncharacterized lipoprotein YbaY|uniref:YbaY family lipoprotein n=1 Tax=Pseudomonas alabamensis TaxID=3064349 RepID=UPI000745C028|nr:YbaY family lipoprotein [Pseudomonas entomophila]AMA45002.1 hypothetical protein APT63_04835 [Pseudomonas monteilii]
MEYTLSQLTLNLVYPASLHLPQGALMTYALEDHARADAAAVTLARQTIRCVGTPPASLVLHYDPRAVDPKGSLSIQVSIACEGNLLLINDEQVPVAWPDIAPVTVPLVMVDTRPRDGIHGGNLIDGIHGGNLIDGIHGGNLVEGIHGGNRMEEHRQ